MFLKQKRLAQGVAGQDNDASNVDEERLAAEAITVGSRCEVTLPGLPPRRGLVMFVGKLAKLVLELLNMCIVQVKLNSNLAIGLE